VDVAYTTEGTGNHTHTGVSGSDNTNHTHYFSATSGVNSSAANWAPRYSACMLARKD